MRYFRCGLCVLIAVTFLSGCNPVKRLQHQERALQLETVVNTYRKLMRWGHYDQAAQYVKPREGEPELPDFEQLGRFRVTSLTIADQLVADTQVDAKVTAYFEFYDVETGVAKSIRDNQFWWYDDEANRWFMGSPMIDFTAY